MSEGLLAWQTKTMDWGGFEVVSEGGMVDYVKSVGGGGLVSNDTEKRRMRWGGDK